MRRLPDSSAGDLVAGKWNRADAPATRSPALPYTRRTFLGRGMAGIGGTSEHGVVDDLRARVGGEGSAGIRRAAERGARRTDAADRGTAMVGGPAAEQVSGRQAELVWRSGAVHQESAGRECGSAEG